MFLPGDRLSMPKILNPNDYEFYLKRSRLGRAVSSSSSEGDSVASSSHLEQDEQMLRYYDYEEIGGDEDVGRDEDVDDIQASSQFPTTAPQPLNDKSTSSFEGSDRSSQFDIEDDPEVCMRCGDSTNWRELVECSACFQFIHMQCCEPKLEKIPDGDFFCHYCSKSDNESDREEIDSLVINRLPEDDEDNDDVDENSIGTQSGHQACELIKAASALYTKGKKKPLLLASVIKWVKEGRPLTKSIFLTIVDSLQTVLAEGKMSLTKDQLQLLRKTAPPANIPRVLRSCGEAGITEKTLIYRFPKSGVEAVFYFSFRNPYAAALDLHQSAFIRLRGPIYDWNAKHCKTGRIPNLSDLVRKFAKAMGYVASSKENLTLPVQLYSDETRSASGNVQFNPMWLSLATIDPDTRLMCNIDAHALVGFLPDEKSIEYRFSASGKDKIYGRSAESLVKSTQKTQALNGLKQQALMHFLSVWKSFEQDGMPFVISEKSVRVRIVLFNFVSDMKERRVHLGLRKNVYHCSACYDFPAKNNEIQFGLRTTAQDLKFRKDFIDKQRDTAADKRGESKKFDDEHNKHGITLKDNCPFTKSDRSQIFMENGPYASFRFDALHMKDGIVDYYMSFLATYLGEDTFIGETVKFGNIFLKTKRFSMHIMEKGLESFHFIPIALAFGTFEHNPTAELREKLVKGSCDLLRVLALLTDPCPHLVKAALAASIVDFKNHVEWLLGMIMECANERNAKSSSVKKGKAKGSSGNETPKMHHLFAHAISEIENGGLADSLSAKMYETFHEKVKEMYGNTSHRRGGSAFREIVLGYFYRMVTFHVQATSATTTGLLPPRDAPWKPVTRFHISVLDDSTMTLEQLLEKNVHDVHQLLFREYDTDLSNYEIDGTTNTQRFGNTLKYWFECELRKVSITPVRCAVVPGTSKGNYCDGAYNAIAYRDSKKRHSLPPADCVDPNCRHHHESFQLFCSSARDADTAHGVPLLFVDDYVVVWPLVLVNNETVKSSKKKKKKDSKALFPNHPALLHYQCDFTLELVSLNLVRGECMLIPDCWGEAANCCFVVAGKYVFGHE